MSPVRKTADYRSVEIDSWDEFIQDEIAGLYERGEMDDLPDKGKPIKIWTTDVNPEYDLAFSRLKNAGVKPLWMELDQEIGERTREIWARLDAVENSLRGLIGQLKSPAPAPPIVQQAVLQRLTSWFRIDVSDNAPPPPSISTIMSSRDRERTGFLELAAELDEKISTYHDSLPKGGEHLQRLRWLPGRAERIFDDRIVLTDWWEEARAEHS